MALSVRDVEEAAALARLALGEEEKRALVAQLASILAHMDALRGADAPGAAPDELPSPTPLRPDLPGADPLLRPPAESAPAWRDGFFLVPRLASHQDPDREAP